MKKIYLLLVAFAFYSQTNAQTLNEPANWPNPDWTLSGTYSATPGALEADPAVSPNFAFDDDDAGSVSDDDITTTSPVIDLTAAHTAGETSLKFTVQYIFRKLGTDEVLNFEYWNADTSEWVVWSSLPGNDTSSTDNFCNSAKTTFVSDVLSILNFTPTQLSGFRYRIHWDDSVSGQGYQWGFCLDAPTLVSLSCPDAGGLSITGLTTTSATLAWNVNPAVTLYNVEYGPADFTPGTGTMVNNVSNPTTINGLDAQTSYQYYVQSNCGVNGMSDWAGPFSFMTPCEPIDDFNENFDSSPTGSAMPECWTRIVNTTGTGYVNIVSWDAFSDPNSVEMYNSGDGAATLLLVSPNLSSMTNKRVKFRAYGGTGYQLQVGTMLTPANAATFTSVETKTMTGSFTDFNVTLNGAPGNYLAFKHSNGGTFRTILIDNVIFEDIPSTPPACVADAVVTPDAACGNFATSFAWTEVEGADGYRLKVGTTTGGTDIVNNVDLGSVISYSLVAQHNTTYYYTITAYNANGDAVGCTEDTFTTASDGCYCTAVPTSVDGVGITEVQAGTSVYTIADEDGNYADKTTEGAADLQQAVPANLQISMDTDGFDYYTNVWIDFNDDFNFASNELVFQGVSSDETPTTLNATFNMPVAAPLGEHRMRIAAADSAQFTPNPCYSGSWGNTVDLLVNITPAPTCLPPTGVVSNVLSSTSASITWVSASANFNIEYGNAPLAQGSGIPLEVNGATTTTISSLDAQTDYQFYIQAECGGGDDSPWVGPFSFTTLCDPFGDFTEDFSGLDYEEIPECWNSIENLTNDFGYVGANAFSGTMELYNSDDANAELVLITPQLTDLPLNTHRAKFKARGAGYSLIVGTMSNSSDGSTFVPMQTITLTGTLTEYNVTFNTSVTGGFVAFKHGLGGTYRTITIDDFIWEPIPSVVPDCAADVLVTPDDNCGNFATSFEWTAVEGADGYKLTVGTTSGGTEVLNNVDLGNVLTYSLVGTFNTTYYYTLVPYNAVGPAVGCTQDMFTTAADGCYCTSVPTSNDGNGITNIQLGTTDFTIADETYTDKTADGAVDVAQGEVTNLQMTIDTFDDFSSYTYDAHAWIDFNDNFIFEASEKVFTGVAPAVSPTTLDMTFTMSPTAALGEHRLRIGTADSGQATPNPCYSNSYGNTVDLLVNIVPLSTDDFSAKTLKVYPNPVKNTLFLEYAKNISSVAVFNIIGQQVIAKSINANQSQIDMSNLAAGTYLVKVTSDNQVKTIKVVKQ